jgi:hypothetical protein
MKLRNFIIEIKGRNPHVSKGVSRLAISDFGFRIRSFIQLPIKNPPFAFCNQAAHLLTLAFLPLIFALNIFPQKIAVVTPKKNPNSEKIAEHFAEKFKPLDSDLVEMAVKSQPIGNIFNLSTEEAKTLSKAIGCDFFILLKSENLRRTSFAKPVYFESYAVVYLVSARTGRLVFWTLKSFEAESANLADKQLFGSIDELTSQISSQIKTVKEAEITELPPPNLEELPDENSPAAKNFKSPLPYARHVPVYKRLANLYGIAATVDAVVDLDENGKITRIEITRWAGYDLDESVKEVINRMNWRPASRDGKTLPIRVLLRYNFKKIEKAE